MFTRRGVTATGRRAAWPALVAASCLVGVLVPATAQAELYLNVSPTLASPTVSVGDVAQGRLTVINNSTSPDDATLLVLDALTLVPSCGAGNRADPSCVLAPGADPGVITIGPSAVGAVGSACAAIHFDVAVLDDSTGKVEFRPTSTVRLGGAASGTCVITFTYSVNRMPTLDTSSGAAGMQTGLVAWASSTAPDGGEAIGVGYGTATVRRDTPELVMTAAPKVEAPGELSVATRLTGTRPDGSITFELFGPTAANCSGTPIRTDTIAVNASRTYRSSTVPVSQVGTYRWQASYSGDDDNNAVTSACNDPAAATVVTAPQGSTQPGGGTTPGDGTTTPGAGGTGDARKAPISNSGRLLRLDGFALSRKSFARAAKATALTATAAATPKNKKKKAKGTTIRYKLSDPATVTIVIERVLKGRRSGSKCVKATAKLKRKKSCTRYVKSSTLKRTHKSAGAKKVAFGGRAGKRALPLGKYRMRAKANTAAGATSPQRTATFKIVRN